MLAVLRAAARHPARFDPGKWADGPWHLKIRGRRRVRVAEELRAHEAAGSLAEELPYWGWLDDGRACLTPFGRTDRGGPAAACRGGRPHAGARSTACWACGSGCCRGCLRVRASTSTCSAARLRIASSKRTRTARTSRPSRSGSAARFLEGRVQRLDAYVVWSHGSGLRPVARSTRSGPFSRLARLRKRRRKGAPTYLASEIEAAADRFRAMIRRGALAGCRTHAYRHPGSPPRRSRLLSELINRPGTVWDGATGSGMNWRLALSELEAERSHLRLDGEPVVLYSLLSPPGQAHANLLKDLYCLDATITVSLEWRPWTTRSGAAAASGVRSATTSARRYSMMSHVQETQGTAAAMVDSAAAAESDRLGGALVELEADGVAYGEASLTVALHGELSEIERLDGDVRRLFAAHDAKAVREGYGQLPVWFSRLPAQPRKRQVRNGVRLGRARGVPGARVRAAQGLGPEPAPRPRVARVVRDAVADGLSLRLVPWRRGPHADPGRDGIGQEFCAQLPAGRGAQVAAPGC